jgi:hypothetical protein
MTKKSLPSRDEVKILNGEELSTAIKFSKAGALGLTMPGTITGTHFGIFGCDQVDGTYKLLHDKDNVPVGVQDVRAGRTYVLFLAYPYPYIKFGFYTGDVDATHDASLATQAAERTFTDLVLA